MPWRGSLMTAGSQSTMAENMLWRAENVSVRLDGTMEKRPGVRQWGQSLLEPDVDATGSTKTAMVDFLTDTAPLVLTDASSGLITTSVVTGELRTAVPTGTANKNISLTYPGGTLPAGSKWSFRMVARILNAQAYNNGTTPNTFAFRVQAANTSGKEFAVWSGGLYYKQNSDSKYVLIPGTENMGTGVWSTVEIHCDDAAGSTLVYYQDALVATLTSANLKDVTLTGTNSLFELRWEVEGSGSANKQYSTSVITPMYNDVVTAPFIGNPVVGLTYFPYKTTSGSRVRSLVAGCGRYIYHDNAEIGVWRPLKTKQYTKLFFTTFDQKLIWCDFDNGVQSAMWEWSGSAAPVLLTDAPKSQFVGEHKARLFAAGNDEFPLRLHYTGSRQSNLWFSPSEDNAETEIDAVFEAGYIQIPAKHGDAITGFWGNFYGLAIVATRTGVWQLSGSGPTSWRLDDITQTHGIEASNLIAQVVNDLWYCGSDGVHTVLTTDKYGQVASQKVSTPIGNMWSQQTSGGVKVARDFLNNGRMVYSPQQQLVYLAVPLQGEQESDSLMVYSLVTQGWYGPWNIESRALCLAEIVSPLLQVVMHGSSDGKVGYTYPYLKSDYDTGEVTMTLETAALTGRSVDQSLHGQTKTWKTLYLYVQPRGKWDFSVTWYGDSKLAREPITRSQISDEQPLYTLSEDMRLDEQPDGTLRSDEEISIIKIPLDERSAYLYLIISETAAGEDLIIQGAEIEFTATVTPEAS